MSSDSKRHHRHGSCLCGSIQYQVSGNPFTYVVCHCVNCKKSTGSGFMTNAFFKADNVDVLKGSDRLKEFRDTATNSGRTLIRAFCSECGSSMFLYHDTKEFIIVTAGTLDDTSDWVPKRENLPEQKHGWIKDISIPSKPRVKL